MEGIRWVDATTLHIDVRVADEYSAYLVGCAVELGDVGPLLSGSSLSGVEELRVHVLGNVMEIGPTLDAVLASVEASSLARRLRGLVVLDLDLPDVGQFGYHSLGALRIGPERYPALERATLRGRAPVLQHFQYPSLRELRIETCCLEDDELASIARTRWARLETLALWIGTSVNGEPGGEALRPGTLSTAATILDGTSVPTLRHLGIMNCEWADELCRELVSFPLISRLASLDLSHGTMTDAGARALAAGSNELGGVELISFVHAMSFTRDGFCGVEFGSHGSEPSQPGVGAVAPPSAELRETTVPVNEHHSR